LLYFVLLGNIAESNFTVIRGLSVTFVHCAQTAEDIDTISSAYDGLISPDRVEIRLASLNP